MAWSGEPDDNAVQTLLDFTDHAFDRNEAIKRLKANNCDVTQAVGEFYDNPDSANKYQWDDSVWSADRDATGNTAGVQFNVQGPDVTTTQIDSTSAAPTRPPSRTNNRSPLAEANSARTGAPATQADEDADLQRALAESAAESGLPPQESGVTAGDVNEKKFGPATRAEYEQDQWAMVPTKVEATLSQKSEIPPSARKRDPAAPAFLRASKDHRVGAILTILSHIPLARNALLSCGTSSRTYGYNGEWWAGHPILKQENLGADNQDEWSAAKDHPDFHDELHRLIAFLENGDRAYASVDGIVDTDAIDPHHGFNWGSFDFEDRFFEVLKGEYEQTLNPLLEPLMSTARTERIVKPAVDEMPAGLDDAAVTQTVESDSVDEANINFLTIPLMESESQWVSSLYNALDAVFWSDAFSNREFPTDTSNTAVLTNVGAFFVLRIGGDGLCKPCDVPVTLYLDRYMEDRKAQAITIQTQIHKLRYFLSTTEKREKKVLTCSGATDCRARKWFDDKPHSARDCWQKTIEACEALIGRQRRLAQRRYTDNELEQGKTPSIQDIALIYSGDAPYELTPEELEVQHTLERAAQAAEEELADIDRKLEGINSRRQQFLEALDHLSMRLTTREDEAPQDFVDKYITPSEPQYYKPEFWNPTRRFLLRGVATTNEITYVCTRRQVDPVELGDQAELRDQWWRLVYAAQEKNPIIVEKTDAESVSIAAGSESKHPLFVYASEDAMNADPVQLSDALRTFVRADNKVFQNELSKEQVQTETWTEGDSGNVASPGDGPVPLTADAINAVAPAHWASVAKRKHSPASSVATINSTGSRNIEMVSYDDVPQFADYGDPSMSWHHEYASPVPHPNKLGGLVESLEKCQTYEPESPVLGRRDPPEQNRHDFSSSNATSDAVRAPEMQERSGGPSPFMVNRPVERASQAAPGPANLMDMDVDVDIEHHEG
ncbi:hypothetical protein TruAng_000787 [Truncatella angustata]|nr:hypothetical protein TruAng_000787 [Truncatella angustata]